MFRSAFLTIKPSAAHTSVIDAAIALAKCQGWQLSACSVIDEAYLAPPEPVPLGAGAFKAAKDVDAIRRAREAADQNIAACAARCAQNGVSGQAVVEEGDIVTVIAQHAAEHDLLLAGHSGGDDTADNSLLWRMLKHCSRPALIFPNHPVVGQNVLAAYDGSFQASRALAAFVHSGLAMGRNVHVLACDADAQRAQQHAESACRFLKRHAIDASVIAEQCAGSPSDAILAHAARTTSGLLVMGAFGKSAVREFVFGSVTQSVLRTLPLPVLLDH